MSQQWSVDGQVAGDGYKDLVFTNAAIEKFLNNDEQFIVVASKGMGKTLLMRLKRDKVQAENPSIIVIPQNNPSDYVNLMGSYEKGILASMGKQAFWEFLWKTAIQTSILLNFPHRITDDERAAAQHELKRVDLPSDLHDALSAAFDGRFRAHRSPSSVLSLLLRTPTSKIEKLRASAPQALYELTGRHINSACFVFIDSFDQAMEKFLPGDLEAWAAAQRGLLLAAWDVSRQNRHIKVYVTIRQEAYASFDGTERNNIKGSVLLLRYSKEDLHALFTKAITHYEGLKTVEDFVGLPAIFNDHVKRNERAFDYIHRHLIDVPRWLTYLGGRLSDLPKNGKVASVEQYDAQLNGVRDTVNRVSAELAEDHLCSEMKLFFQGLSPSDMIRELFSRVHSTVLSFSNVDLLSKDLTRQYGWNHPFSLLYNLGLLGLVQRRAGNTGRHQVFKRPYEFDWSFNNILPEDKSGIYLLHPALHHLISTINPRCRYSGVLVGDGLPWTYKHDAIVRRETIKLFVSYAHADEKLVLEAVGIMKKHLDQNVWLSDIWFDAWKMHPGRVIQEQIGEGLKDSDFVVLMVSPNSMKSEFVEMEWKSKVFDPFCDRTKTYHRVLPVHLGGSLPSEAPLFLQSIHGISYSGCQDERNIQRLIELILTTHRKAA